MYTPGMKVKINKEGHDKYGKSFMNPVGKLGVVIERPSFLRATDELNKEWSWVRWQDGVENSYEAGMLDVLED